MLETRPGTRPIAHAFTLCTFFAHATLLVVPNKKRDAPHVATHFAGTEKGGFSQTQVVGFVPLP